MVGGGLLGLQVARALGVRGVEVDLVEAAPHLLASHIGEPAGTVLRRSVEALGCEVYPETRAVRLTDEETAAALELLKDPRLLDRILEVEVAGVRHAADLQLSGFYDPKSERMRG